MKKIKPLDQIGLTDAKASIDSTKLQNIIDSKSSILDRLMDFASSVPDFRRSGKGNKRHGLPGIIMLIILSRIVGKKSRAEIIMFGRDNIKWFTKLGLLKNGVPSEATLCRVENGIDDIALAERMRMFVLKYQSKLTDSSRDRDINRDIISIDGKAERGTVLANGRNPDIVSAYSPATGIVLATEACQEKSNEIKAVPLLIDKIDISGKVITADAMSMQKEIIDRIRSKGGDFMIELKANQRSLRYVAEDWLKGHTPVYSYTVGPEIGHGRIETRTYRIYDGLEMIADKEKWGGNMTVVEYESDTIRKSTGEHTSEKRLYVCSLPTDTPLLGHYIRCHWSIEIMHWVLDVDMQQDSIRRKYLRAARNLDTILRIAYSVFSIWKGLRKKRSDKKKGVAELKDSVSNRFSKLLRLLNQK